MVETTTELNNTLTRFYESVRKIYPVRKMLLYGSYAKGTTHKDSDIDVAVVVDRVAGKTRIDITENLFFLARKINYDIEPKCIFWDEFMNPEPASILAEILKTSKEIAA